MTTHTVPAPATGRPSPEQLEQWSRLTWNGTIPLQQILDHARPAYCGPAWETAFDYLLNAPSEREVIDILAASVDADGLFREPVVISMPDPEEDYEPDEGFLPDPDAGYPRIANGMHRIATAYLLGATHIRALDHYPPEDNADDTEYVEVHMKLTADTWPECCDGDLGAGGFISDWLRSFPLPDGTWVANLGAGSTGGLLEAIWSCPHTQQDTFLRLLRERCERHNVTLEVLAVKLTTPADWDDDEHDD